jgi:hypothetical protein
VFLQTLNKYSGNNKELHIVWDNLFETVTKFMVSRCAADGDDKVASGHSAEKLRAAGGSDEEELKNPNSDQLSRGNSY